ncbi:hypothetical protein H9Q70_008934 [Fusarium xylarioides]|nr:hypothetical protein H9Q70_008934 [Fusarium xylarioides]KAG5781823.1 hypothetical protein H9Q73_004548 [Fusarium xylarioides]
MTIRSIQPLDPSEENEDAVFLPILGSFLSLSYGIQQSPWFKAGAMVFCRLQLEKFGPRQFTANLRDQLFAQMRMATIPWPSTRDALKGHFEIASKIKTRKGKPFKIFHDIPSYPTDLNKQDIFRYMNTVGQFNIRLEEINNVNIDTILMLCIGLMGGERGEAFMIEQVVHIAPIAQCHCHPQHRLQGGLSLVVGVVALPLTPGL